MYSFSSGPVLAQDMDVHGTESVSVTLPADMFGPALLLAAALGAVSTISASTSPGVQYKVIFDRPVSRTGPRPHPSLGPPFYRLSNGSNDSEDTTVLPSEAEFKSMLKSLHRTLLSPLCRSDLLRASLDKLNSMWPGLSPCHALQPNTSHRRRRRELPFSPFSTTVSAWNDFETDHFPVYDWGTRLLIPVLKLLPLLGLMVMAAVTLATWVVPEKTGERALGQLDSLAETVWSAIDKYRETFEG